MNKKLTIVIFTTIVVIFVGAIVFSVGNSAKTNNTASDKSKLSGLVIKDSKTYYGEDDKEYNSVSLISTTELSKHNSETDCWVVYQEKVYDLTSWLPKHPGTAGAILPYCGTQSFEQAFIKKHGNTKASLFLQVAKLMGDFQLKGSLN